MPGLFAWCGKVDRYPYPSDLADGNQVEYPRASNISRILMILARCRK